ncbi:hypothetical protein [Nocardiopsis sp. CNR-923]|uniref:hypothetical protein n=1 Tax=Nocardiopsis sp. CNR-923 TaxID=1904965 RepID=UPI00117D5EF5|nr:hypothetical protein [Nocardiopsis sp. CNR-923]
MNDRTLYLIRADCLAGTLTTGAGTGAWCGMTHTGRRVLLCRGPGLARPAAASEGHTPWPW